MDKCKCYVQHLDRLTQFGLHYGAHDKECPSYRESGDPVDRWHDDEDRRRLQAYVLGGDIRRGLKSWPN